jgi:formiminotetrahydrofolate cyclodeaminase
LPKQTEEEKRTRSSEIQGRLKAAADVPMMTAEQAARIIALARAHAPFANANALSDLQTAIYLANASTMGALANVSINLSSIKDENYRKQSQAKISQLQSQIEKEKIEALKMLSEGSK